VGGNLHDVLEVRAASLAETTCETESGERVRVGAGQSFIGGYVFDVCGGRNGGREIRAEENVAGFNL
jgi:hypothetical protein